jgi:hypothetical protein
MSFKLKPENGNHEGVSLKHYLEQRTTVNNEGYIHILRNQLKPAIRRQRRGLCVCSVTTPEVVRRVIP